MTLSNQTICEEFQKVYFPSHFGMTWMGVPIWKNHFDLWCYHEIVYSLKPDLIIEGGTHRGGSALFLAHLLDIIGCGEILTIDIEPVPEIPGWTPHPRIHFLTGSTLAPEIFAAARAAADGKNTVIVILDDDHSMDHVLREMELYSSLVTAGSYLIVEDGNINGHPVAPGSGPGPAEALDMWLPEHPEFEVDRRREPFITFNPSGYLKRRAYPEHPTTRK